MASPSQNFTSRLYHGAAPPLPPSTAAMTWALATATFFLLGLAWGGGLEVTMVAQVVALAAVPVAVVRLNGGGAAELGLTRPPALAIVGAALTGGCTWYVTLRLALPIVEATGREREVRELTRVVLGDGAALPWVLVASALVPGVCEEILHRGMLLPALAARAGRGVAVVAVAVVFGVMHLEPARMVAAGTLGLGAGAVAVWSRSLWPAITLHVVNNAVALLAATGEVAIVTEPIGRHPDGALAIMVGGTLAGLGLCRWVAPSRG